MAAVPVFLYFIRNIDLLIRLNKQIVIIKLRLMILNFNIQFLGVGNPNTIINTQTFSTVARSTAKIFN